MAKKQKTTQLPNQLPPGKNPNQLPRQGETVFDSVKAFKQNVEQGIVDSLFDYFGRTYYEIENKDKLRFVRNEYQPDTDRDKIVNFQKKIYWTAISLFILGVIGVLLGVLIAVYIGFDVVGLVKGTSHALIGQDIFPDYAVWLAWGTLAIVVMIFAFFLMVLIADLIRGAKLVHRSTKNTESWNAAFYNFSNSLDADEIVNAVVLGISDLEFDKGTPVYDKRIYNLHNRLHVYANIPKDARRLEYRNMHSGFYKTQSFTLSYSKWEWYRTTTEVDKNVNSEQNTADIKKRTKLHRFTDSVLVMAVDTHANPDLNFVLNNFAGRNCVLSDNNFNSAFRLAVNDKTLAAEVLTHNVQRNYYNLKNWSHSSKLIRQVIKEGDKVYIIADGDNDFMKFDRIVNPYKNIAFNTATKYGEVDYKVGSLNETATLITEYVLDEVDLLYTMLEYGVSLPVDPRRAQMIAERDSRPGQKTLKSTIDTYKLRNHVNADNTAENVLLGISNSNEITRAPIWNAKPAPTFEPSNSGEYVMDDRPFNVQETV